MVRRTRISAPALLWAALLILLLPLRWLVAAAIAAAFHELCHMLAVKCCGGSIADLRIGPKGASMDISMLTRRQELIAALAGPAGSLLLTLTAHVFPTLAVCALVHGAYNLLPVYPMDGGRALYCGTALLIGEEWAEKLCTWVARILCAILLLCGVFGFLIMKWGILPLIFASILTITIKQRKMPCKERDLAVQ